MRHRRVRGEMMAMPPTKHSLPRKTMKGGTTSTRKHRFQSFNQRIAKLKIDPIRRRRHDQVQEGDLSMSESYFRTSLDRWKDLNLSEDFTAFAGEVDSLCNNLAQVLHYNKDIFKILTDHISKKDGLSLEPLLDLLSNLAHDLDYKFEEHFSAAVTLVASLASQHKDVEVIEWSFTCLSWLFKYLSRLLLPDLKSVFEIMAPFLGREPQKPYTVRFAAEAMSFLVRKAAVMHARKPRPLTTIIDVLRDEVLGLAAPDAGTSQVDPYPYGLMSLLLEAMKGVGRELHSGSTAIICSMIDCMLLIDNHPRSGFHEIVYGVIVALIHHCDATSFHPILEVVLERVNSLQTSTPTCSAVAACGQLLFVVATVRKGTRIQDWTLLVRAVVDLLRLCRKMDDLALLNVYKAAAVMFQSAPLDVVLPQFRLTMEVITHSDHADLFLPFCNYFCDLGRERFHDLLLPYFLKFFENKWRGRESQICAVVPKFLDKDAKKKCSCPDAWQSRMVSQFQLLPEVEDKEALSKCNSYLELIEHVDVSVEDLDLIFDALNSLLTTQLNRLQSSSATALFTFGKGLKALSIMSHKRSLAPQWPGLCRQAKRFSRLPPFLEAILLIAENETTPNETLNDLIDVLIDNTHSSSHALRSLSLQIIDTLYARQQGEHAEIIQVALSIENSQLDLQSARSISMQCRRLASLYEKASSHKWLCRIIPHFCFGMLTFKLSQVWEDAIIALKQICETKVGEDSVASLAFMLLDTQNPDIETNHSSDAVQTQCGPLTAFQCSNLIQIEVLIDRNNSEVNAAEQGLNDKFDVDHQSVEIRNSNVSALALRVLLAVPQVAEKRSRRLVPMFLSWADSDIQREVGQRIETIGTDSTAGEEDTPLKFSRKYQKAMLDLFSRFTNPRVLYQASEVFKALQSLLSNGDIEMQRTALKAIFAWNMPGLQPYQENLLNILDDARLREEISTFVQVDDEISAIQEQHRPDLMPVMLRLLYGKIVAGTGSGSKGQAVKRKAVLRALSQLNDKYLLEFIHVAIGRLKYVRPVDEQGPVEASLILELVTPRKQVGLLNMMRDMLQVLGDRLASFAQILGNALIYCMVRAARGLQLQRNIEGVTPENNPQLSLLRAIRQIGMQCLNLLFRSSPASSLQIYVPSIFKEILSPQLDKLPIETAQSVSGYLQLLATWASSESNVLNLVNYDSRTLKTIIDCLDVPTAKDDVKLFVIDILQNIVQLSTRKDRIGSSTYGTWISREVLQPNMDFFLRGAEKLLRQSPSKVVLISTISLISALAPLVEDSPQVANLLGITTFLLDQPSHRVSPKSKGELLQVVQHFMSLIEAPYPANLFESIFRTASSLFLYFKDRPNRATLVEVMSVLGQKDEELKGVAQLCKGLNAYSSAKIDEPDYDARGKAYNTINETEYASFTPKQWHPILHNLLFFVKDSEEPMLRSRASHGLQRFVETNPVTSEVNASNLKHNEMVELILLPALHAGASDPDEMVRNEYLNVMAHLTRQNSGWSKIRDMSVLLFNDDEEASFFGNVLHIQQHRRLRALRRLATAAQQWGFDSANVAHFLIPLLEHFIFDKADDESAHNLSAESVTTIGALASCLDWPQFRAIFQRYGSYIKSKPDDQKAIIKLLGVLIDALARAVEDRGDDSEAPIKATEFGKSENASTTKPNLEVTAPKSEKLTNDLTKNLLPSLEKYLHDKDESTVSLRVPVAVSVVKLLKVLPHDYLIERLPPVLTDVCHILRSRAQESRDLTRKTLVEISTLIGPAYFGFVLKELRSSLARGYQLHVLSYTVHSILVATSSIYKPGDLDYCLPQIVAIIMDDIFGVIGQEKDAEDYISKMKEVKSSKSFDSMELIAKTATVEHFAQLVRPLQALLGEKLDLRMVRKIDELLRRIGAGLLRNDAVHDQRVLKFCHEIISEAYKQDKPNDKEPHEDHRKKRYLVNYKGAAKGSARGSTSTQNYKLARFALDVLRSVLQKHESLQTPVYLDGFIPIIGDAIIQSNEELQISSLRLLTTIIKVPLKAIDENAPIYVIECVKIIKSSTSTNVELAQAALKLVSALLRERRTNEIREADLSYLLKRILEDLEEPDKSGIAFNYLKAVMTRKIMITEVYEVLDKVAEIMVRNHTKSVRDMARGAYLQFITEYPQSKRRFDKQLDFLALNLNYESPAGRQSVMEAIHLVFNKIGKDMVQDVLQSLFIPLVMAIVNDDERKCREMAGALMRKVLELADRVRTQSFLGQLRDWLDQKEEPLLVRVSLQVYLIYFDVAGHQSEHEIPALHTRVSQILKSNLRLWTKADWELLYFALQTISKITEIFPLAAFASSTAGTWANIRKCLSFPHAWVKLSTAKLLGTYFADFAKHHAAESDTSNGETALPLKGSNGLWLNEREIVELTRASIGLLRVPNVSEELSSQSVRNLVFLGKIMAQTSVTWPKKDTGFKAQGTVDEAETESEEEDDAFEGFDDEHPAKPALGHLILSASRILRRGNLSTRAQSLIPLQASLSLLGALTNAIPLPALRPHIPTILLPLHNLTDPAIAHPFSIDASFTEGYKTLKDNAQAFMALLQKKLGTTEYINTLSVVRQGVKARREGRRVKRRIEMVAEPERAGKQKKRKGEKKREKRKERSHDERGRRRGW